MANKQRLIDAYKLEDLVRSNSARYHHVDDVIAAIAGQPTVDAVELPCKMGDIVWGIQKHIRGFQPKQGIVNQMYFGEDMRLCVCVKNICRGEWGKKVFATKEDADAVLAKMDGGNEDGK